MTKKILFTAFLFLFLIKTEAQQLPDFTLSKENTFTYNPAYAGTEQMHVVSLSARKQWLQMQGSPLSLNLAYHTLLKKKNIGLGGYVFTDFAGPSGYTGVNFSFAYHLVLKEKVWGYSERHILSFGVSLSAVQYRINGSQIKLDIPQDEAIYSYKGSQFYPDASFGIHYTSKNVKTGLSIPQLLHLDVPINSSQTTQTLRLRKLQHYYAYFSYEFDLSPKRINNRKHYIQPSVNVHYVINAPFQALVAFRYDYDHIFFAELGYRSLSTMTFGAGVKIAKQFSIAYAYDFNFNPVRSNLGSVHELLLRFEFDRFKK